MNTTPTSPTVTRRLREQRNGHVAKVIWFTGLSASGKTTIANAMQTILFEMGVNVCMLDGDDLREGLCSDLTFTPADRLENLRRAVEVANILLNNGMVVLASFITPTHRGREMVRAMFDKDDYVLVHVDATLATCEARDTKGLYKRARLGEITDFVGVGVEYEVPVTPDVRVDTNFPLNDANALELAAQILSKLGGKS